MQRSWSDLNAALLDPTDDELVAAPAASRTGDALSAAANLIAEDRSLGRRSTTHPDFPAMVTAYPGTVEIDAGASTAVVEYCRVGSNIYVEVGTSTWWVTWELSDCRAGRDADIPVSTVVPYDVVEIQTVGTCG